MKAIAVAALLGLSFSLDIKKDLGDAIHDAGDVASIVSTGSQIASHLYAEDNFKVNGHEILHDAGDAAKIIGTGIDIASHFAFNLKKDIGDAVHDAGDVASIVSAGSQVASHLYAEDNFKVNGQKILNDAGDVAKVIGTGLSIADHLYAEDNFKINGQKILNDAGTVAGIIGTGLKVADHLYAEDNFKVNGQKILNDAGDVAKVIGTGLSIADHLYAENGDNAEELLNIKKIGEDIGKVAKVALPIAGLVADAAAFADDDFKVNGQKILHDAGDVAGVIGTGLKIVDHFAFFETESGEEKGFLSF